MPYLFDTDAISEALRHKPALPYVRWLARLPRAEQFASAVSIGELYAGAFRSPDAARHLEAIEERVLPALTILPYEASVARIYGSMRAGLEAQGQRLADADLQIAATAVHHGLELVTGNLRHFRRVAGLTLHTVLADARREPSGQRPRR
jgi:tRNA(fMet)-specific endonuclease VapC